MNSLSVTPINFSVPKADLLQSKIKNVPLKPWETMRDTQKLGQQPAHKLMKVSFIYLFSIACMLYGCIFVCVSIDPW